jgi:hypothetical protein
MVSVLFILKRREDFDAPTHSNIGVSTGLYNSAKFVNDMLVGVGIKSNIEVVVDNNDIDRQVTKYKPTHVIIEALWVVPEKFQILKQLHPNVTWIIRLHSELPFLAGEGMAMNWIGDYSKIGNLVIACNAPRMLHDIRTYLKIKNMWSDKTTEEKVIYLPNYYPKLFKKFINKFSDNEVNIGCFGAIRPLKNHMVQIIGALEFANSIGKKLNFHINSGRIEMSGGPTLNNVLSTFEHLYESGHRLINHPWTPRDQFLNLCGKMDIGLQVSFSETFNIVGCDFISQGIPFLGSPEIPWISSKSCADPTSSKDISYMLLQIYDDLRKNVELNQLTLSHYVDKTRSVWVNYFEPGELK